jgi:hypothetical protein
MADTDAQAPRRLLPTVLLVLGILLILTSWTPIGKLESEAVWTPDDSVAYSRLVEENHRIAYEAPERSGLTDEQLAAKRQRIEQQLAAKIEKLEYAKSRPEVWSRNLFWSGALLVTLGGLSHLLGSDNASSI